MSLVSARAIVMAGLSRCPVCGAAVQEAERSCHTTTGVELETVVFECEAALYLQTGGAIGVSRRSSSENENAENVVVTNSRALMKNSVEISGRFEVVALCNHF